MEKMPLSFVSWLLICVKRRFMIRFTWMAVSGKNDDIATLKGKQMAFQSLFPFVKKNESLLFEGAGRDLVVDGGAQEENAFFGVFGFGFSR